jgi:hypothetical protein
MTNASEKAPELSRKQKIKELVLTHFLEIASMSSLLI